MKRRKKKLRKIICFIFLLVVVLVISFSPFLFIDIKLIGNKVMDLDYGEKYSEPGFKAYLFNKDITDDIKVSSNVKEDIGSYEVVYS